jgi:hypothetical protein
VSPEKITRKELREALLRSGYLIESRVESFLLDAWGYVEANAAYEDPLSGKSRELDVFALTSDKGGPEEFDFFFNILLIECINNPQPLAFITKEPLAPFLHQDAIRFSGLPIKILEQGSRDSWIGLGEFLAIEKFHHYCEGRVATQFCSFTQKKSGQEKEWFANHEEPHFDSIKKLCDAVDYYASSHFRNWTFDEHENLNIQIYYPLLIVQGELLEVKTINKKISTNETQHIQFRRSAVVGGDELSYQIDVIQEAYLQKFLDVVNKEKTTISRLLRRRHKIVRKAIDLISNQARKSKSQGDLIKVLQL